ncbi:MAG: hypothetical protein Q4D54_01685 [Eubacteriales bacterium]|nr:hypothetical protein [Eubacteriales bacterium]
MKKGRKCIKRTGLLILLLSFMLYGCAHNKKEYKIDDTSSDRYIIEHFKDDCKKDYKYTAHNTKDIVYIDGGKLYRYSDGMEVLDDVQIREMIFTETYLYVLDDSDELHILDMTSLVNYELSGVLQIEFDGNNLYLEKGNDGTTYYVEETQFVKDGHVIDFENMNVLDDRLYLNEYMLNNGFLYWTNCDRKEVSVLCKKIGDTGENKKGIKLDDTYYISEGNLSADEENGYILYSKCSKASSYAYKQGETYCDGILALDFDKEKTTTIYETDNNLTRIIGFDSNKNYVYLYDVNSRQIQEVKLDTNQQTTICTLDKKYNSLLFEKSKDVIFVYTGNNELVQIVDLY